MVNEWFRAYVRALAVCLVFYFNPASCPAAVGRPNVLFFVGNDDQNDWIACGFFRPHEPRHVSRKYYETFSLDKITLPKIKKDVTIQVMRIVNQR